MPIRRLELADIPEVLRIQKEAYAPQLLESAATFIRKLTLFPDGCLGYDSDGVLCGYAFAHPWRSGSVAPLHDEFLELPSDADCLFVHDVAVAERQRGRGIGHELILALFGIGERMKVARYTLVAVQASESYWQRFGFRAVETLGYAQGIQGARMTLERPDTEV